MTKSNKRLVWILLIITVLLAAVPLLTLKDAEFGGSDDAGSVMIEEIEEGYEPWFTPVAESFLGKEIRPDGDRRGRDRILHGTSCGTEEVAE